MDNLEQPDNQDSDVTDENSVAEESISSSSAEAENDQASSDAESNDTATEEEHGELDVDGQKFSLPKSVAEKLNSERMMNADYTRKTQALAEDRRQLESHSESLAKQHEAQQQFIKDHAKVVALDDQLAAYEKLDWNALIQSDPVQAMTYQQQQRELERQRDEARNSIAQKQQQFALDEQQTLAKRVQEAKAYVEREIPNWTNKRDGELQKYAQNLGFKDEEIGPVLLKHPVLFSIFHKAELYDQLAKKPAKPQQQATTQAKPVPKVGENKSVQKDPGKMTDKEFAEYRRQQIRNRN